MSRSQLLLYDVTNELRGIAALCITKKNPQKLKSILSKADSNAQSDLNKIILAWVEGYIFGHWSTISKNFREMYIKVCQV